MNFEPAHLTPIIATLSLVISIFTLWKVHLDRGTLKMTRSTSIFFGPDNVHAESSKIWLKMLLFSTSQRGQVIESMYVKLFRGESVQTFNIWAYEDKKDVIRGSGLYVGKEGVPFGHTFFPPKDGSIYAFIQGKYKLEVYASLLNRKKPLKVFATELVITDIQAVKLKDNRHGIYFDWGPESNQYHPYLQFKEFTAAELAERISGQ